MSAADAGSRARAVPEGVNLPMDGISIPLTGRNSLMDWGLWLLLIGLIARISGWSSAGKNKGRLLPQKGVQIQNGPNRTEDLCADRCAQG